MTEGNQGYQTDAAQLVKAKLILLLTKYVKKYGWDKLYAPSTWGCSWWTPDGKGQGPGLGHRADRPERRRLLQQAEAPRARLQPQQDAADLRVFDRLLAQLRAKLPDGEPVIGTATRRGTGSSTSSAASRAPTSRRRRSATGSTTCPARATTPPGRSGRWASSSNGARAGYFNDDYNALGYDASATEFAKGKGVFWIGGLGLDDHQDRPRRRERRRDAGAARAERRVDVDRRPVRSLAYLGEDEVPGPARWANACDHVSNGQDVLAAADPGRPARRRPPVTRTRRR